MLASEVSTHIANRLAKCQQFLDLAELAEDEPYSDAMISLCVTAGVNASDAVLAANGRFEQSRRNHDRAPAELREIGQDLMASTLSRLLRLKSKAQYSPKPCTAEEARSALHGARKLLELAKNECDRKAK